jgi:hypothetical protein
MNAFNRGSGNFGGLLQNYAPNSGGGPSIHWSLYILVALAITIIIMMLMNTRVDLSWLDPRPKRYQVTSKADLFMKPSSIFTNLVVPENKGVVGLESNNYSMTIEGILYNSRNYNTTEGPYKHILHRGSDELVQTTVGGMVLSGCAAAGNGTLPPYGLPKRMNPGIFLDPNVNDIIVFVDTAKGTEMYRESVRIQDIPLDSPFRVGIVVHGNVMEVYINCRLEVTKVLMGEPKSIENVWYGLSGGASAAAQIQNLYVWKFPLTADDIRPLCPLPIVFAKHRPICEGADTTIADPAAAAVSAVINTIDLGLGAVIRASCSL